MTLYYRRPVDTANGTFIKIPRMMSRMDSRDTLARNFHPYVVTSIYLRSYASCTYVEIYRHRFCLFPHETDHRYRSLCDHRHARSSLRRGTQSGETLCETHAGRFLFEGVPHPKLTRRTLCIYPLHSCDYLHGVWFSFMRETHRVAFFPHVRCEK